MRVPLKAEGWWHYKLPPMLAVAYYAFYTGTRELPVAFVLSRLGIYLIAVIGIAGFGHVLLDAFDVEEDRLAGKSNLWAGLTPATRTLTVVALLAASWLPWTVLPLGAVGTVLVGLEFLMFALYAVPPVRLKERGIPGIFADASYAHALPALWTWVPFAALTGARASVLLAAALVAWTLSVGMRHLLQHQALEYDVDKAGGVATFAVRHGRDATFRFVARIMLPFEIVSLLVLLTIVSIDVPILGYGFVAHVLWTALKVQSLWVARIDVLGALPVEERTTVIGILILTRFYERWLPLLLLLALAFRSPAWIIVLALHVLLFRNGIMEVAKFDIPLVSAHLRARRISPATSATS